MTGGVSLADYARFSTGRRCLEETMASDEASGLDGGKWASEEAVTDWEEVVTRTS